MKQRSALLLAFLVVCLLLIPFSPGLSISPFIALTVIVAWMREKCSSWVFFIALTIIAALSYTTAEVLYPIEVQTGILKTLIAFEKPALLLTFGLTFFLAYPTKIYNIGGILAVCAIVFLFEEFLVTSLLAKFPPHGNLTPLAGNPYLDFSPGREMFELVLAETEARASSIPNIENLHNFKEVVMQIATYQATLNIIANLFYVLIFLLFLGRFFMKIHFFFTTLQLPRFFTYTLLLLWALELLVLQGILTMPHLVLHSLHSAIIVFSTLHFFQGLSLILFKLLRIFKTLKMQEQKNASSSHSLIKRLPLGRISFFSVLLLLPLLFVGNPVGLIALPVAISLLGLVDVWFNYRKI